MKRREVVAGLAILPLTALFSFDVAAARKAGTEIRDKDGTLICRLARDVVPGEILRTDQFTDWQIPIPAPYTEIHQAIAKFAKLTFL